jgi:hypothetical protein
LEAANRPIQWQNLPCFQPLLSSIPITPPKSSNTRIFLRGFMNHVATPSSLDS